MMITAPKQPPLVEDLRSNSQEQMAELRQLLATGAPSRPDPRRPGFYEVQGLSNTYYVFKYPTGTNRWVAVHHQTRARGGRRSGCTLLRFVAYHGLCRSLPQRPLR